MENGSANCQTGIPALSTLGYNLEETKSVAVSICIREHSENANMEIQETLQCISIGCWGGKDNQNKKSNLPISYHSSLRRGMEDQISTKAEMRNDIESFCLFYPFSVYLYVNPNSGDLRDVFTEEVVQCLSDIPFQSAKAILLQCKSEHIDHIGYLFQRSSAQQQIKEMSTECAICCEVDQITIPVHQQERIRCTVKMCTGCIFRLVGDHGEGGMVRKCCYCKTPVSPDLFLNRRLSLLHIILRENPSHFQSVYQLLNKINCHSCVISVRQMKPAEDESQCLLKAFVGKNININHITCHVGHMVSESNLSKFSIHIGEYINSILQSGNLDLYSELLCLHSHILHKDHERLVTLSSSAMEACCDIYQKINYYWSTDERTSGAWSFQVQGTVDDHDAVITKFKAEVEYNCNAHNISDISKIPRIELSLVGLSSECGEHNVELLFGVVQHLNTTTDALLKLQLNSETFLGFLTQSRVVCKRVTKISVFARRDHLGALQENAKLVKPNVLPDLNAMSIHIQTGDDCARTSKELDDGEVEALNSYILDLCNAHCGITSVYLPEVCNIQVRQLHTIIKNIDSHQICFCFWVIFSSRGTEESDLNTFSRLVSNGSTFRRVVHQRDTLAFCNRHPIMMKIDNRNRSTSGEVRS